MWICFDSIHKTYWFSVAKQAQRKKVSLPWNTYRLRITSDAGNDSHFLDLRLVGMMSSSWSHESQ